MNDHIPAYIAIPGAIALSLTYLRIIAVQRRQANKEESTK